MAKTDQLLAEATADRTIFALVWRGMSAVGIGTTESTDACTRDLGGSIKMRFEDVIEFTGKVIDGVGVAIVAAGSVFVLVWHGARRLRGGDTLTQYRDLRRDLGRVILLGLELLVAADIIRTVAATPTFRGVGVLAVIVLIRTFLSMTLEVEVTGQLPWRRRGMSSPANPEREGSRQD